MILVLLKTLLTCLMTSRKRLIINVKSPEVKKPVKQYLNLAVDNGSQVMPKASNSEPASFEDAWKQLTSNSK